MRRWLSALLALFLLAGSFALNAPAAHAGSQGVGYDIGMGFLGAYNTDVDGRQAYCADLDADPPYGNTSGPETVTSLDSLSRQQLAELNYVHGPVGAVGRSERDRRGRTVCVVGHERWQLQLARHVR